MAKHKILVFNEQGWEYMIKLMERAGATEAIMTLNSNFRAEYDDETQRAAISKNAAGPNYNEADLSTMIGELENNLPGDHRGC